jgi:hypothetical protein
VNNSFGIRLTPALFQGYAKSNYPAVAGRGQGPMNLAPSWDGIFYRDSGSRAADILDGTSNTLAVGERDMDKDAGAIWIRNADASHPIGPTSATHCDFVSVAGCGGPGNLLNSANGIGSLGSMHVGGAFFLFADGSVQRIGDEIDTETYGNLCDMADGCY